MTTLLIFIATFAALVFFHEWGHFIAAKKQGIAVHEFGFGFPPRLFSFSWKGTLYSVNLIPLGGFVRIKGEEGDNADDADSFANRPAYQRVSVIVAGVFMNVLLGWGLITIGFASGFPQVLDGTIPHDRIRDQTLYVVSVIPNSPAAHAGLKPGDEIRAIDGTSIFTVSALQEALTAKDGIPVSLTLQHQGVSVTETITPIYVEEAERTALGVGLQEVGTVSYPFFEAVRKGITVTGSILKEIVFSLGGLVRDLVVTQRVSGDLAGPVGIAVLTGQMAQRGFAHLLQFAALLSLNLAVLNILPIPALDGGRLFFLGLEKIRRRPISPETESTIHRIGFILLLLLVLVVTYTDIMRFFV